MHVARTENGGFAARIGLRADDQIWSVSWSPVEGRPRKFAADKNVFDFAHVTDRLSPLVFRSASKFVPGLQVGDTLGFQIKHAGGTNEKLSGVLKPYDVGDGHVEKTDHGEAWALTAPSTVVTLTLAHVDPLSIVVRNGSALSFSGSLNAAFATLTTSDGSLKPSSEPETIDFTNYEMGKRFARALMHAALICGGTKAVSPF